MKSFYFFLIICLYFINVHAQGWVAYPINTTRSLSSVYFTDWANGWAVGDRVIIDCQDTGIWWYVTSFTWNYSLSAVHFIDTINSNNHFTGYAVGYDWSINKGVIFKTTNSGRDWDIDTVPHCEGVNLYSVHFVNIDTGWTVGSGKILKTTDSGDTWFLQRNGPETDWLRDIFFINPDLGWCVGWYFLARTTNGGASWIVHPISSNYRLISVHFINENIGWTSGTNGRILKTTDGGITWNLQNSGVNIDLNSIYFVDTDYGWAVGVGGIILRTTDGGENWIKFVFENPDWFASVHFYNKELGWVVGGGDYVLRTTDGGITFIQEDHQEVSRYFKLSQNFPNPFNPSTVIHYSLKDAGHVSLRVFDVLGRVIAELVNEVKEAGHHSIEFNSSLVTVDLPSGFYIYTLKVNEFSESKKMLLLK